MKKLLAALLATSSVVVFADSFQDFNNNLYVDYTYSQTSFNAPGGFIQANGVGLGGTFQSKNNVWLNASVVSFNDASGKTDPKTGTAQDLGSNSKIKLGYAFDMFGNDDSGLQVIPYASFVANANNNYAWGIGVQPEYRFLGQFKASLGLGLQGANGTFGQDDGQTLFTFNVLPQIQYDIAKTVMVAVGYNYASTFNSQYNGTSSNVNINVGYLF